MSIDPATTIGPVHLTIADLDRSVRFYDTHLGFTLHHRDDLVARLGAGGPDLRAERLAAELDGADLLTRDPSGNALRLTIAPTDT